VTREHEEDPVADVDDQALAELKDILAEFVELFEEDADAATRRATTARKLVERLGKIELREP
jgi:ElaB/YqjD/DUF883 family membrane-anchored ribosome-binding protein